MSRFELALADAVKRASDEQHALFVRMAHLQSALLLARQGENEGVVRALLEAKGIVVLCQPVAG